MYEHMQKINKSKNNNSNNNIMFVYGKKVSDDTQP